MSLPRTLHKWSSVSAEERCLFIEAVVWLGVMRLAILLLPFRWIVRGFRLAQGPGGVCPRGVADARAARIGLAIARGGAYTPWQCTCFTQSLTGMAMLRRRGMPGTLYLGVAHAAGAITAHSWLCSGTSILTGAFTAPQFIPVASFTWRISSCVGAQ